ncbi:YdaS family helix-turn-helix protein [Pseudomonas sp. Ps21-P2]|uniref:transcriptional regulator n=1 Tax=Pseudomonas sp. Ps21-P2 TaxID=3080331 RepID=UPI00320A3C05
MNLANYVERLPRGGKKLFAIQLGVTASYLSRLISGDRSITAERAIQIEDATGGAVSRVELRPDIPWEKPKRSCKAKALHAPTLNQKVPGQSRRQQVISSPVHLSST